MGLNEDLGDRENVGSASLAFQRAREKAERTSPAESGQPSEPAGLVERMCEAFMSAPEAQGKHIRVAMKPAYEVAKAEFDQQLQQKLDEALAEPTIVELDQAGDIIFASGHEVGIRSFIANRRARLYRKKEPSLQEQISKNLKEWRESDNYVIPAKDKAAEIIALVRAEIGGEK